jgi:two-component system chemotaxis response regulator CheB
LTEAQKVRVLVVDDSSFMRIALSRTLGTDPRIEVVGQARDGAEAVEQVRALSPDVVTMDFNMPRMNGAEAVRAILKERPTAIVMLSAHTVDGAAETLEALAAGAVDFLTKPDGEVSTDLTGIRDELVKKVLTAARARPQTTRDRPTLKTHTVHRPEPAPASGDRISFAQMVLDPVVVIAVSTGGPAALERVIPALPPDLPYGVLVVQHMPAEFTRALAARLASLSSLEVREAKQGERMVKGRVLIAPGDRHVVIQRSGMLDITQSAPVNNCRPSADVTLQSAAPVYGPRLTAVVMTGMGRDGAVGAAAVRAAGGKVIAQDRETSVVWGMPRAVVEMGVADEVLPLNRIAARIAR